MDTITSGRQSASYHGPIRASRVIVAAAIVIAAVATFDVPGSRSQERDRSSSLVAVCDRASVASAEAAFGTTHGTGDTSAFRRQRERAFAACLDHGGPVAQP